MAEKKNPTHSSMLRGAVCGKKKFNMIYCKIESDV